MSRLSSLLICFLVTGAFSIQGNCAPTASDMETVRLVVPYPAGGETDKVARDLAPLLSKHWKSHTLVVENQPSENGQTAIQTLLSSKADGKTLMLGRLGNLILAPIVETHLPQSWREFTYIAVLDFNPMVCVVPANSPIRTAKELVQAIKSRPGQLKFGTAGSGSIYNFFVTYFLRVNGLSPTSAMPVHYLGGVKANAAIESNQLDFMCPSLIAIASLIKKGSVRPLFVTTNARLPEFANVPTANEIGMRDLGKIFAWSSLVGPPNMPQQIVKQIRQALVKVSDEAEWKMISTRYGGVQTLKAAQNPEQFIHEQAIFYENLAILTRLLK